MKRMIVVLTAVCTGLCSAMSPDALAEVSTIEKLPLSNDINQWKSLIERLRATYPEEEKYFNEALTTVEAVDAAYNAHLRDADKNIVIRAISGSAHEAAIGALRENTEQTIQLLIRRGMKRSLKPEDRRTLMLKALYQQLLKRITTLQEQR